MPNKHSFPLTFFESLNISILLLRVSHLHSKYFPNNLKQQLGCYCFLFDDLPNEDYADFAHVTNSKRQSHDKTKVRGTCIIPTVPPILYPRCLTYLTLVPASVAGINGKLSHGNKSIIYCILL